jgi:hypothetical protein
LFLALSDEVEEVKFRPKKRELLLTSLLRINVRHAGS